MVTETDPVNPVNAEMRRAIGRLEGATAALLEGQREIKAGLHEQQQVFRPSLHEQQGLRAGLVTITQRLDRLFYMILAGGGVVMAVVIASRFNRRVTPQVQSGQTLIGRGKRSRHPGSTPTWVLSFGRVWFMGDRGPAGGAEGNQGQPARATAGAQS